MPSRKPNPSRQKVERVYRAAMRLYREHGRNLPVARFAMYPKSGRVTRVWYRPPYDILEDLMRACAAAKSTPGKAGKLHRKGRR